MNKPVLLEVNNLKKHYEIPRGMFKNKIIVKAVDNISFQVRQGETFALVGESGCGKSTTGRTILRLVEPTGGEVKFDGINVNSLTYNEMRKLRVRMQMVFQDPYASLNPKKTIREILLEPLNVHNKFRKEERLDKVRAILEIVGLSGHHLDRYPHEFSGGQRQRIGIARTVILQPDFIIADEPVSALDVSVQSQVINLMLKLQKEFGLTYLFISHDLSVVSHMSDRMAVMYLGKIVEEGDTEDLFKQPKHPYTKALISAIPATHPREEKQRIVLKGDVPSPADPPKGCTFHPRCPFAMEICKQKSPPKTVFESGQTTTCHLYNNDVKREEIVHAINYS